MKSIHTKPFFLFALGVVLIASCKKDSVSLLEKSTWVESNTRKDTIIFTGDGPVGSLFLNRAREVRSGHLLPQLGDGLYSYKELKDSIFLHYSVSSYIGKTNYAFKMEGNRVYIGDFYKKSGKLLVFKRLK
jgi:hypothetical protein